MKRGVSAYGAGRRLLQQTAAILLALAAAPSIAADRLVLAFGDSLTAGYGLSPPESFPVRLEAALRKAGVQARVHNAGVSGDTSAAGRQRLAWVLRGVGGKPDLAIVELGANDMLRGLKPAETRANLESILAALQAAKIPVLLAGMRAAPNMGAAYAKQFEPIYPSLAARYHARLYPFFLDRVAATPGLLQADGMHPNAKGVDVIVAQILPAIRAALGAALMDLEDLLRSYFGTADLETLGPDALEAAIERLRVAFGTTAEPGCRFAVWTLLHSFDRAPDPATAFKDPKERKAAEDYAWAAERIARREEESEF